jgi:PPOX class probable FMN-dependent enzyme
MEQTGADARVTCVEGLEEFGRPNPVARDKVEAALKDVHREWIAGTPLMFVATSDRHGHCDVSPKGDPPGFVHVLDDKTIAIPERAGNRRFDGFHNILQNPHVGLVLVIPGRGDTLRINGRAVLVSDATFFEDMIVRSHRPELALVVTVDEVFFHCPKAFVRANAWQPEQWQPDAVRSHAELAKALWRKDEPIEQIEARLVPEVIEQQLYPQTEPGHGPER